MSAVVLGARMYRARVLAYCPHVTSPKLLQCPVSNWPLPRPSSPSRGGRHFLALEAIHLFSPFDKDIACSECFVSPTWLAIVVAVVVVVVIVVGGGGAVAVAAFVCVFFLPPILLCRTIRLILCPPFAVVITLPIAPEPLHIPISLRSFHISCLLHLLRDLHLAVMTTILPSHDPPDAK